jgi:VIT1/CCC1 family predicted Fe2+/Mn2+ transporter
MSSESMADPSGRIGFTRQYLDPASRLSEVLFGLIMVLTVTLTAGLTAGEGKDGLHQLLIAAVGCNIAWGIIDGIMYVMNGIFERSRKTRMIEAVKRAADERAAANLVRREIDDLLESLAEPEERERLSKSIVTRLSRLEPARTRVTKEDLYGAIAVFWLVFVSCIPAAVPFLVFSKPHVALRVSNLLLTGMLFWIGWQWAKAVNFNRMAAGSAMVLVGLVLVGVAIALGG